MKEVLKVVFRKLLIVNFQTNSDMKKVKESRKMIVEISRKIIETDIQKRF